MKTYFRSYPPSFWKLSLASLFFFFSFNMVIPDLPLLLNEIGGQEHSWLIIPAFASVALISRPFSGKISDVAGRVFVMGLGAFVTAMACVFYIFIPFVFVFFINRAFHGLCAGFTPTGYTAYADDIVPVGKRGEAMGIIGICNNLGNALGWVMGSKITNTFGMHAMFSSAAIMGMVAFFMFISLEESIQNKQRFHYRMFKINRHEMIEWRVLIPGLILLLTAYSSGAVLATIADFTNHVGIQNRGMYMSVYIFSSLFIRFMAGRWSDVYGRRTVALWGAFFVSLSMMLLALASGIWLYSASAVFFGIGFGLISPSLFAWAADLALPGLKGKAVGTLFIFLEIGIIVGSALTGLIYDNDSDRFPFVFYLSSVVAILPLLLLMMKKEDAGLKD